MARKESSHYTKPKLRESLKARIMKSSKGGKAGQWSARKSQLLATEYKKEGGGYRGSKGKSQKDLDRWTDEEWQTKSGGSRARKGKSTSRYLPKKAWEKLTPAQRKATDTKKRKASRKGKQVVANTKATKKARKSARKKR